MMIFSCFFGIKCSIFKLRERNGESMNKMSMLPNEVSTIQDLAVDGLERHENSIIANVPKNLAEKGVLAVTLFMYFMDQDTVCEWTGRKTFMNVEESYLMSGVYPDEHLKKVYRTWNETIEVRRKDGSTFNDYILRFEILDRREDMRIRAEAKRYWQANGLEAHFEEVALSKMGMIDPEKLIRYAIIKDAINGGENEMQNRRLAVDVLGMKVKKQSVTINLRKRGGGEIIDNTAKRAGAGFLGNVDVDEDDDE